MEDVTKKQAATFKGSYIELVFAAGATKRNWGLSTPFNDILPYDFIVDTRANLHRMQVKTCRKESEGVYKANLCTRSNLNNSYKLYSARDVDYFAIYIENLNIWYIIPVHVVKVTSIRVYPDRPECKFSMYRDAWHLLG